MDRNRHFFFRYIGSLLLFGFNGIVASHIPLDSTHIVLLRSLLGSMSLLAFFFLSGHRFSFTGRGQDVLLICLSGAAMGASWMLLYEGYQRIGVATASLLYYCGPVIVMALSPLFFREKLTYVKLIGFSAVCAGIVLINGLSGEALNVIGCICGIGGAVFYAVMLILNKKARSVDGMENSLLQMLSACADAGIEYMFSCGYRTLQEQTDILEKRTQEHMEEFDLDFDEARKKALETVAVPGTSEHQMGLAVDIVGEEANAWLGEHCWEYGFILRYTEEKAEITGITNEPWHFRYVGREISMDMKDSGLCLE